MRHARSFAPVLAPFFCLNQTPLAGRGFRGVGPFESRAALLILHNLADSDDRWVAMLKCVNRGSHHDEQNRAGASARRF
jgi:hypothetical protein